MKNKLKAIIMSLVLVSFCIATHKPALQNDRLALTIIVDTSWSCEKYISDFASLSRQAISSSLGPGSYIEVFSAHPGNPRIRIAQTIKSIPGEINGITAILKTIRSGFLTDATVSTALDMTFKRLEKISARNQYGNVAVVIFSDGCLSDNDARRVVEFSEQFQKKGWSLYMTGTKDTNKRILVAANQNKLHWSFISEANPVLWLESSLKTHLPSEKEPIQLQSDIDRTSSEVIESHEQQEDSSLEGIPCTCEPLKQEDTKIPKTEVIEPVKSHVPNPPIRRETTDLTTKVPERLSEKTEATASSTIEKPKSQKPIETQSISQSLWNMLKKIPTTLFFVLFPIAALVSIFVIVFLRGMREAQRWRAGMNSRLKKSQPSDDGVLIAKVNGQSYRLGKLEKFKSVHLGSDASNAIRVLDKSIAGRHAVLYKDKNDLMVKNLAKSPIVANNAEIKPGHNYRLVLPSVIKLNDHMKLNLILEQHKVKSQENGEGGNNNNEKH